MSIQLRVKHIFFFTHLFHKVSFDGTTLSRQCQKSLGEGEGQRRKIGCACLHNGKHWQAIISRVERKANGNKEDTLRKKKQSANFHLLSCIFFVVHFSSVWRVFPSLQQNNIKGLTSMTAS